MLHAVDASEGSLDTPLDELRAVLAVAYDHVKLARRYAASLSTATDLSTRLQLAEAELVRAKVALTAFEQTPVDVVLVEQPAVILGAPFGKNRRGGHEYRN